MSYIVLLLKRHPALLWSAKPFLLLEIEIRAEKPTTDGVENGNSFVPGGLASQSGL
jgi:hypothetical protein